MAKTWPIEYIRIISEDTGLPVYNIRVQKDAPGIFDDNILCVGNLSLYQAAEVRNEGFDPAYTDGHSLPSKQLLSGKNFTLNLWFHGTNLEALRGYDNFSRFVLKNDFIIQTQMGEITRCQGQSLIMEPEQKFEDSGLGTIITATLTIRSENSFFNFN